MRDIITNDISGVEISYYFICKRKLWLFAHNIQMEHTSEAVEIGAAIHEHSYKRKRREIDLDGIKFDFIEPGKGLIHEVKKSKAVEDAHIWQLKYYLYRLKKLGVSFTGKIDYPLIRRTEEVGLNEGDEKEIEHILGKIGEIKSMQSPPPEKMTGICKKCSYFEFCFA
jgi:CRISPR-associated exonuclease Cas4